MGGIQAVKLKKALRALLFILIFLFLFCRLSYILRPYGGSASRKNLCGFYAEPDDSLEVVFVGASSCFTFWEPMEFWHDYGVTSFNFATGAMPPQFLVECLKEVRKTQSPKLFVIDLRPFTVAHKKYYDGEIDNLDAEVPIRNVSDNFKFSFERFRMIEEKVPDFYDKIPYYFDIIKYHTEWERLWDRTSQSFADNEAVDYTRGFNLVDGLQKVSFKDYSHVEEKGDLSDRLETVLDELLRYCDEERLPVLFLVNIYRQSEADKKIYNYISDAAAGYGFPCLNANDYYREMEIDFDTDYYDNSHVNIFGADKYTDFIGKYLMERYDFEDRRGEEEYARWDQDYTVWTAEKEKLKKSIQEKIDGR